MIFSEEKGYMMQRNILEYLEESGKAYPDKILFADDRSEIT